MDSENRNQFDKSDYSVVDFWYFHLMKTFPEAHFRLVMAQRRHALLNYTTLYIEHGLFWTVNISIRKEEERGMPTTKESKVIVA